MADITQATATEDTDTASNAPDGGSSPETVPNDLQALRRDLLEEKNRLGSLAKKTEAQLGEVGESHKQADELLKSLREALDQVKTVTGQVEKTTSKSQALEEKLKELETKATSFVEQVNGTDGKEGWLGAMEGANKQMKESADSFAAHRKDLSDFHDLVMGNEEQKLKGARKEFEEIREQYQADLKKQQVAFEALTNRIEGLLPGATSAGLAYASKEQKRAYRLPILISAGVAVGILLTLVIYGIATAEPVINWSGALLHLISHIHIYGPGIWLVIIALRKLNQFTRLEQEYAHKETLANTYVGFIREVEKLPETEGSKAMREELLNSAIASSSYNPSTTLDGAGHDERPPVLDKLADVLPTNKK
ncbi:MAG: hypothetical protein KF843_03285 [Flavobacteriales bacterium]|jgi:hypothetical protein|nr:hypothetical protein [Flavobacteriales bacterium]MBZ0206622.1 hypothetical protein [Flavobacteriales bacterium]